MNKIIINPISPDTIRPGQSIAIGFFDGIHLGHQKLIEEIKERKEKPSLMTFDISMKSIFSDRNPDLLLTQEEKDELLASMGIENEYIIPLNKRIMNMSKGEFLSFLDSLSLKMIVIGKDFTFGKNAEGRSYDLYELSKSGTDIHILDLLKDFDEKISSTNIKGHLLAKDVEKANSMLGYPFFITGEVIHGLHNGRKISFPTANMEYPKEKIPLPVGVYKTNVEIDGRKYLGMTNIGSHPTIDQLKENIIETNIFDFNEDIYDKKIKVSFLSYIREQKTFSTLDELKNQLQQDKKIILS